MLTFPRSKRDVKTQETEGSRLEKLHRLRRSLSGYKASLTRIQRILEELFMDYDNYETVIKEKQSFNKTYKNFISASMEYKRMLLPTDSTERTKQAQDYASIAKNKAELDERLTDWMKDAERRKDLEVESVCSGESRLTSSNTKLRLLHAELEKKRLSEIHRIQREQLEYENKLRLERLELEIQSKQVELDKRKQLSNLQSKIDETRSNYEEQFHGTPEDYPDYPDVHFSSANDREYLKSALPNFDEVTHKGNLPKPIMSRARDEETFNFRCMQDVLKQQQEALLLMAQSLGSSISRGFEMPKREYLSFDGNPINYPKFVENFKTNIEAREESPAAKLSYLIQFCTGVAKEAISSCVMLPPEEGYKRARQILEDNFGQGHIICRAYINNITKGNPIKPYEADKLLQLAREMENCQISLSQLGYGSDIDAQSNLEMIVSRLPSNLQAEWAKDAYTLLERNRVPKFDDLSKFVMRKAKLANSAFGQLIGSRSLSDKSRQSTFKKGYASAPTHKLTTLTTQALNKEPNSAAAADNISASSTFSCLLCKVSGHNLQRCSRFRQKGIKERREFVLQERLCYLCLSKGHVAKDCKRKDSCLVASCGKRHHSLLHQEFPTLPTPSEAPPRQEDLKNSNSIASQRESTKVMLRVIPVKVKGQGNIEVETYALLDDGSDVSICECNLIKTLGLPRTQKTFSIKTVNGQSNISGYEAQLNVSAIDGDECIEIPHVWAVPNLPIQNQGMPTKSDLSKWSHLKGIEFPQLDDKRITLLIGSDVPEAHWIIDQRRGKKKQPYAILTPLGWTLMGPIGSVGHSSGEVNFIRVSDEKLRQRVEKMFLMDFSEHQMNKGLSSSLEDKRALNMMEGTLQFINGHYQLGLPWRKNPPCLPNNRAIAERRLNSLKWRLQKNPILQEKYVSTINDYIDKRYAQKVPAMDVSNAEDSSKTASEYAQPDSKIPVWYLPHHPVFHPRKPGKVRVVFDCGAKSDGTSLNDQLLQGPVLTNTLVGVLLRFRQEKIGLMSDIEAMYHQARVKPDDCNALRFLWWPNDDFSKEPEDYQMLVHLFGAKSSPSCASFCLLKTAENHEKDFDAQTVNTVQRNFYVDDCLKSVDSVSKAITLVEQLTTLLAKGGFHLTKWASNDVEVLKSIPKNERSPSVIDLELGTLPTQKALGVTWETNSDTFSFGTVKKENITTRRGILSFVSSIYDPLGLASPFILQGKQILQSLCKNKVGWDELLDPDVKTTWDSWTKDLPNLESIVIPRCLKHPSLSKIVKVDLHHFSDASNDGYGTASYLRFADTDEKVHCSLLMGKSRVTPTKPTTIPRLELTAAVVAVRLNQEIQENLDYEIQETFFWTDSTLVLQYINNEARRFKPFIANRLAVIHEKTKPSQWKWVDTNSNPADHASRGLRSTDVQKVTEWIHGPKFLWQDPETWPKLPNSVETQDTQLELRKDAQVNEMQAVIHSDPLDSFLEYYSSWYALKKGIAWLMRYLLYLKKSTNTQEQHKKPLSVTEVQQAAKNIVTYIQHKAFSKELEILKATSTSDGRVLKTQIGRSSKLSKLNPVLIDGTIHVGGRLELAPISYGAKHPMILPSKNHVTNLIIRHYHVKEGHLGTRHVWNAIRQVYWIINGRAEVRKVINQCIQCRKRNARPGSQIMAPLPAARVTPYQPPFTCVGVDYFGPLTIKLNRSHVKRYGCLFTCLATRAVHIEIAYSLDSESFLCAFSRFTARRGQPKHVYSDNGTNFTGAQAILREEFKKISENSTAQEKIRDQLRRNDIQWHFNPPAASHMGGVWERLIRSIRRILKALLQEQLVTDETLVTFMAEVERILNDRPLVQNDDTPDDLVPLTPSKLLLLQPNPSLPLGIFLNGDKFNKRWRQAQWLANTFWKRWIKEYLPALQERQKWTVTQRNLKQGDLVLMVDERRSRGQWPLAIVEETFPDRHGSVRQVSVRTATSRFVRDVRKLCLLEASKE